jgi:hypothetical protein
VEAFIQSLPPLNVDLLVVPNAALNQITAQSGLPDILTSLCRAVPLI